MYWERIVRHSLLVLLAATVFPVGGGALAQVIGEPPRRIVPGSDAPREGVPGARNNVGSTGGPVTPP